MDLFSCGPDLFEQVLDTRASSDFVAVFYT